MSIKWWNLTLESVFLTYCTFSYSHAKTRILFVWDSGSCVIKIIFCILPIRSYYGPYGVIIHRVVLQTYTFVLPTHFTKWSYSHMHTHCIPYQVSQRRVSYPLFVHPTRFTERCFTPMHFVPSTSATDWCNVPIL